MSARHVGWAFEQPLKPAQKLVLLALADLADEANQAFPSKAYLAKVTGLSTRSIQRTVADLEEQKLLIRSHRTRGNGSQSSNVYELLLKGGETECLGGGDSSVSPIPSTKKLSSSKRAKRRIRSSSKKRPLPDSWAPTDQHREMATEYDLEVEWEAKKFRDHALQTDRRLVRWDKAFNNWLRTSREWKAERSGKNAATDAQKVPRRFKRPRGEDVWDGQRLSEWFVEWHDQAVRDGKMEPMDLTITRDQVEGL